MKSNKSEYLQVPWFRVGLAALVLTGSSGTLQAATIWTGLGGNSLIDTPGNWDNGVATTANAGTAMNATITWDNRDELDNRTIVFGGASVLSSTVNPRFNGHDYTFGGTSQFTATVFEAEGSGTINLNDSSLMSGQDWIPRNTTTRTVNVSGGGASFSRDLTVSGTVFNLTSGSLTYTRTLGGITTGAINFINTGGIYLAEFVELGGQDGGAGGAIELAIAAGLFQIDGVVNMSPSAYQINVGGGKTTVTVIPEASPCAALALVAVAGSFFRRRPRVAAGAG
jgi:MYXO-CTERM domain-containing protein